MLKFLRPRKSTFNAPNGGEEGCNFIKVVNIYLRVRAFRNIISASYLNSMFFLKKNLITVGAIFH